MLDTNDLTDERISSIAEALTVTQPNPVSYPALTVTEVKTFLTTVITEDMKTSQLYTEWLTKSDREIAAEILDWYRVNS